jgi:hypothetical protein
VRLGFDHHIYQDEIVYSIPFDSTLQDSYYLAPDTIFPDDKEVMADEVEIFYRNYTMREISAKVSSISHHPNNQLLAEIKTVDYTLPSSGGTIAPGSSMPAQPSIPLQILKSEIPAGTTINDFIGGIFLLDGESYIINGITVESTGLMFTVFKKAPSAAIIAGTSPVIDQSSLVLPTFSPGTEGLFSATENMQNTSTWGPKNPNSLKVKIGTNDWTIHREIIHTQQSDGSVQRFLEKSRGFWKNAQVHRHYEEITNIKTVRELLLIIQPKVKKYIAVFIKLPSLVLNWHSIRSFRQLQTLWNGSTELSECLLMNILVQNQMNHVPYSKLYAQKI